MIYVIEEDINGPIKIGKARNPKKRLQTLQVGNPKQLNIVLAFKGGTTLERQIHKDLAEYIIRDDGEWFYRVDEVFAYLKNLSTIEPKTEFHDGKEYIVLWRDTVESPTEFCPFCGKRHYHGQGDGHRVTHCAFGEEKFTRKSDEKVFCQISGYFIRTKNE